MGAELSPEIEHAMRESARRSDSIEKIQDQEALKVVKVRKMDANIFYNALLKYKQPMIDLSDAAQIEAHLKEEMMRAQLAQSLLARKGIKDSPEYATVVLSGKQIAAGYDFVLKHVSPSHINMSREEQSPLYSRSLHALYTLAENYPDSLPPQPERHRLQEMITRVKKQFARKPKAGS
ncbi:MAG: hypothetical protein ACM3IJ_00305 [Candidatus Levyibacteriota bacterium]